MKIVLLLSIIGISLQGEAQTREYFEYRKFSQQNSFLPYRLLKPQSIDESKTYPLVIFLSSETQNGTDNEKQLNHFILELAKVGKQKKYPAIVVAPQIAVGKSWTSAQKDSKSIHFSRLQTKSLRMLNALILNLKEDYPIDTNRIYLIGISEGATAAFEYMCQNPKQIAAVISISGSGDSTVLNSQNVSLPYWAFIGQKDKLCSYRVLQKLVEKMKRLGGNPKISLYANADHHLFDKVPKIKIFDWLFSQSK